MNPISRAALLAPWILFSSCGSADRAKIPAPAVPAWSAGSSASLQAFDESEMAIGELYLQFDPMFAGETFPILRDLAGALAPETKITLGVAEESHQNAAELLLQAAGFAPSRFRVVVFDRPLTMWARDRMIVLGGGRSFFRPLPEHVEAEQAGDLVVADVLARRRDGALQSGLFLEGGNVVVGGGRVFVGGNVFGENAPLVGEADAVRQALRTLFGCDPVVVGAPGQVPHAHLDMYLTAVGDGVVLLGDPRPALELLHALRGTGIEGLFNPEYGAMSEAALTELVATYEGVRAQLLRAGLRVERLPILHTEGNGVFTWNNALLERRADGRRAYVPCHGIPVLDAAAFAVYRRLGFRVFPIDVSRIAHLGGTIRCLTNVLAWQRGSRGPLPGGVPGSALPLGDVPMGVRASAVR